MNQTKKIFTGSIGQYISAQPAYSSISDISPRHLAFEKRKNPSNTAYHVLPIYEKKKNSVQDVLIMSYPFPKMVVSI